MNRFLSSRWVDLLCLDCTKTDTGGIVLGIEIVRSLNVYLGNANTQQGFSCGLLSARIVYYLVVLNK